MAHSPVYHDKGTRFTNYSSIHSADAFVGEYQVMYTPGSTSPQQARANRKTTRFSRNTSARPEQNLSRSYLLPANMPNTSQIMPDHGPLPNIQVHYNVPADEKQIVASLRLLQRDLAEAMQTINDLTRERDEARQELRSFKANASRNTPARPRQSRSIEDDLFDLSSPLQDLPQRLSPRNPQSKKEMEQKQTQISDDARVIEAPVPSAAETRRKASRDLKVQSKERARQVDTGMNETEQSVLPEDNPTAASNTSRRRHRRASVDENMTSAYILPDITIENMSPKVSKAAQTVIHSLDPDHINNCDVCHRLTMHIKSTERQAARQKSAQMASLPAPIEPLEAVPRITDFAAIGSHTAPRYTGTAKSTVMPDYTAALAGFADESFVGDTTLRPKLPPTHALARVRLLMDAQFKIAKERHDRAWRKYDVIEAPRNSRKHAEVAKEMKHWAEKMEELRVHLDYLRDVEEGCGRD